MAVIFHFKRIKVYILKAIHLKFMRFWVFPHFRTYRFLFLFNVITSHGRICIKIRDEKINVKRRMFTVRSLMCTIFYIYKWIYCMIHVSVIIQFPKKKRTPPNKHVVHVNIWFEYNQRLKKNSRSMFKGMADSLVHSHFHDQWSHTDTPSYCKQKFCLLNGKNNNKIKNENNTA